MQINKTDNKEDDYTSEKILNIIVQMDEYAESGGRTFNQKPIDRIIVDNCREMIRNI